MRTMAIAVAVALLGAAAAYANPVASAGENTCLPTTNIKQTKVAPDERSITFVMKDGRSYVNTLPAQCRGLNLHGFTYTSRTTTEVCAGQGITLLQTGTACMLGQFSESPS